MSTGSGNNNILLVYPKARPADQRAIMLPMFLAVVDQTIVATALPAIAASTGKVERASWIVVSYLIASTIAAPIYGRLGDAFGRRRLMFVALAVFIAASLLCAASPTIELLTFARVLQGLGGGGLMTLSQALVGEARSAADAARPRRRGDRITATDLLHPLAAANGTKRRTTMSARTSAFGGRAALICRAAQNFEVR